MKPLLEVLRPSRVPTKDAVEIARTLCAAESLPWLEPVSVRRGFSDWIIWTNAGTIGGNVEIRVDVRDGSARRTWGPLPR